MLFVEGRFFLFFAVVFAVYWLLQANRPRKLWLLGASYLFYGAWDWRFVCQMVLITVIDWWIGARLGATSDPVRRHRLVVAAIVINLGNLFLFKYFNFFADSMASLIDNFGGTASWTTLNIVLPVGISFYTFHMLSYVIDVYRGDIQPRRQLLDVALFAAFFPQLVAGPILRASQFLPQFDAARRWDTVQVRACLTLFLIGYFKKACISDNISPFIDPVFAAPTLYSADALIGATLLYAVQIYCDFSGYTDMALASAGLLGFYLPPNFAWPYLSASIGDFWHRWHISLSSWLRDYLYIPLGGSRHGEAKRYRNLMITMVLGGLWHGASWNFVIWGFLHGLALCVHHAWRVRMAVPLGLGRLPPGLAAIGRALSVALTFWWVCLAWIFFRANELGDALAIVGSYVTLHASGVQALGLDYKALLVALGALHWLSWRLRPEERAETVSPLVFAAGFGVVASLVVALVPEVYRPFVYFQF